MAKKINGLTLHFIPFSEIANLKSVDRIKKLLKIILENKVIILQGKLRPEEETRLIEDTMVMIDNIKGFKGVELAVITGNDEEKTFFDKLRFGLVRVIAGQTDAITIIGPASIVKQMKRDPKKLEVIMK